MNDKKWILGLIILVVGVGAMSVWGFNKQEKSPQVAGTVEQKAVSEEYFSEDAQVMYFHSDFCGWCIKQKEVLAVLGKEGYRVKSMNVKDNPKFWQDYNISGTPTFIASNGERLVGYQDYDKLKAWLDQNK